MSALLPINLATNATIKAEVIVCGGNSPDAFYLAEQKNKVFLPASIDCNRY